MVIDTSALVAILNLEPEAPSFSTAIASATTRLLSAGTLLETGIVIEARYGPAGSQKLDELIISAQIIIEPVTENQVAIARRAYQKYGKRRHPAGLNYGDCFSYALAKYFDEPLLFKGNDFDQTDIKGVPL